MRARTGLVAVGGPLLLVLWLGACGDDDDSSADAAPPITEIHTAPTSVGEPPMMVTCRVQYRPMTGSASGQQEDSLSVRRPVGDPIRSEDTASFDDFRLSATYYDNEHESPALNVVAASSAGEEVQRVLYQFGESLPTFVGGHGFTGLQFVYSGEAELQWWCTDG